MTPCVVNPPPTADDLRFALQRFPELKDPWEARFLLMTEEWERQTDALGVCNRQLQTLQGWLSRQPDAETTHEHRGGAD